ncbi:hypothetical protein BGW38_009561 [Lunasporangiospora selenospora]|uniref:Uncharacterized protein n=1 Tax=Lunasporangiospora selenospora TaxID=979761 RepID=A0A9P6G2C7_9FUNG|nr:hypothetical protein BGW38_009561 [Lunasporangiospora selenospora]
MSTSASRSSRSTRRSSQENGAKGQSSTRQSSALSSTTPSDTLDSAHADSIKTVQELRDELEELSAAKELLEDKVKQLEERVQYVEADARLSASMIAKENMDLKEKTRQLGIELSMVVDERDALSTEKTLLKIPHPEVEEEARQISIRLTDAWLKISNMKTSQEEHVQKLFKAEETNAKLTTELSKAIEKTDALKTSQKDDRKQWESERNDYIAEIESLKKKLTQSSQDGGKQVLNWEGDKARLRESFKYEKSSWDKEKKGFMDQIASLKVKMTSLSLQPKAPPPEWVLEKHQLVERCSNFQSRVTQLESDNGVNGANAKRLETENTKLSKKVDVLKAKLVEVMEHAKTMQEQADEEKTRRGSVSASRKTNVPARPRVLKRKAPTKEDEGEQSDGTERSQAVRSASVEITIPKKPPVRSTRARRTVKYVDSDTSSDELSNLESDETSDEEQDGSGVEEMDEDEPEQGQRGETPPKEESSKLGDTVDREAATDMAVETEPTINDEEMAEQEHESEHEESTSTKRPASRARKTVPDDDSDAEFEPAKKVASGSRGARGSKSKPVNASNNDSEASSKPVLSTLSKKRGNDADADNNVEPSKGIAATTTATTATTATAAIVATTTTTTPADSTSKDSEADKASIHSADASETPTTATEAEAPKPVTTEKVKKKRRLLKGKGLEELGDILNGPGSNMTPSSPSSGLAFGRSHTSHHHHLTKASTTTTTTTAGSSEGVTVSSNSSKKSVHANMDALNAIKLAFSVPKAKNNSP